MPRAKARYDGQENRCLILEAALTVFSDMGFAGASTRAIAAVAGIEQGHLAYYFPSKLALWQQVIEAFAREGEAYLTAHLTPQVMADPVAAARDVLPGYLRTFATNPRLTRMMLQEFSVLSGRHEWVVRHIGQPVWERLRPLFEALAKAGLLAAAPPAVAYFSMIGSALIGFGNPELARALADIDTQDASWINQSIAHIIKPLLTPA